MTANFEKEKKEFLSKSDLSKKGSIDQPVVDLVNILNSSDDYYTTSSCSGRAIVVTQSEPIYEDDKLYSKQDCKWLYATHDHLDLDEMRTSLQKMNTEDGDRVSKSTEIDVDVPCSLSAILKFEPLILHVCCRTLEAANSLIQVAISSGFRNSGLTISKRGRIIAAIRCVPSYQVPLAFHGQLEVSEVFLKYITDKCNVSFRENETRKVTLQKNVEGLLNDHKK